MLHATSDHYSALQLWGHSTRMVRRPNAEARPADGHAWRQFGGRANKWTSSAGQLYEADCVHSLLRVPVGFWRRTVRHHRTSDRDSNVLKYWIATVDISRSAPVRWQHQSSTAHVREDWYPGRRQVEWCSWDCGRPCESRQTVYGQTGKCVMVMPRPIYGGKIYNSILFDYWRVYSLAWLAMAAGSTPPHPPTAII